MNLLDDNQENLISSKISCFFEELLAKYDEGLYPEQTYQRLLAAFGQPANVDQNDVELALAWKYGKVDVESLRRNPKYTPIVNDLIDLWPEFLVAQPVGADATFEFFQENLGSPRLVTNAFLTHLRYPEAFPIVDQHNLRALRYFLDTAGVDHSVQRTTNRNGLIEIKLLHEFLGHFATRIGVPTRRLDKYLMMFGKHVAPR